MSAQHKILVTGGAGYIGAHAVYALMENGYKPVVLDDLSTGIRENLPANIIFYHGSAGDKNTLDEIYNAHEFTGVLHFAGSIVVSESVTHPDKYYQNNTVNSLNLIEFCAAQDIEAFVFSSTAAVYGDAETIPIKETSGLNPINPYGRSKLMTEMMLQDISSASAHLKYAILRYFNVAGADPQGRCGQSTPKATHLIKIAAETACGKRDGMSIFGTDYPTPDGTCIRDYIHVSDLAFLHVLALNHLLHNKENYIANCGYGHGYSVKEVLNTVEHVTNKSLNANTAPRRDGDPAQLVASNQKIKKLLNWTPEHNDLKKIVSSALEWEKHIK